MKNLIVVAGPTASGKTDLAIKIAREMNGAVVSADSRQVYRGMNIGTGKPLNKTLVANDQYIVEGIPHYIFDAVPVDEEFTVAHFKKRALEAIQEIHLLGKLPLLVGGTGLYIRSIVENLEIPAVPPNMELRNAFEKDYAASKNDALKKWGDTLREHDPSADIDFQNPRRLVRALEIVIEIGTPLDEAQKKGPQLFETLELAIEVPREDLYARIDKRVDDMIAQGLEDEVRGLLKQYPHFFSLTPSESPGYAEWQDCFSGKQTLPETIERIKFNTHAYARRQMTWFNKNKNIKWIKNGEEAKNLVNNFLL